MILSILEEKQLQIFPILNISLVSLNSELFSVLKPYFENNFNLARIKFTCLFSNALGKVKTVNYDRLATGVETEAAKSSAYRRIDYISKVLLTGRNVLKIDIFHFLLCT